MDFDIFTIQGLACCLAFFTAGVIDSISGGGGLVTVPTMLAAGIPTHYITGTNQCSVCIGTFAATIKYIKSKKVHMKAALATLPFAIIGAFLGAKLNLLLPEKYLETFMILMIPVIAIFLITNRKLGEEDETDKYSNTQLILRSAAIGLILGGYQGFYGPGAGTFFMLAYAAFIKLSLVRATATTRFVIAVSSITSIATYAFSGAILWKLVIAATIFNTAGSYLGACLAIRNGSKIIKPLTLAVTAVLLIKLIFFR